MKRYVFFTIVYFFISIGITKQLQAQGKYDFLISIQSGLQHTGLSSNDEYIDTIQEKHGILTNTRVVKPLIVSFELYHLQGKLGTGFGIENQRYSTDYIFTNKSQIALSTYALFHNLNFKYNGDWFQPFLGFGTGSYTGDVVEDLKPVNSSESTKAFMRITNQRAVQGKFGVRMSLFSYCGILISFYSISAPISVPTVEKKLELGGDSIVTGFYCQF